MTADLRVTVLHYVGYDDDRGGIVSIVRALAATERFECLLGVNIGCVQGNVPALPQWELPAIEGEKIGLLNFWRARQVARVVAGWLLEDQRRIFHGHSRAGLLVAEWLRRWGTERVVVSVHCYGRQRWFYRRAARQFRQCLFWLSPAMRNYYGVGGVGYEQCIPGGVPASSVSAPAVPVKGRLRLGGVGTLVRWKGWHRVVDALASLPVENRDRVTFTHIGGGDQEYLAELRRRSEDAGLIAQVNFRGPEPSAQSLLGEIDALVVAAQNEPFSIAVLEALAAGVPVIADDSGGARDLICDGVNGAIYRTGDATALAKLIRDWLGSPPHFDREKIRASSVRIEAVAEQWAAVYARL